MINKRKLTRKERIHYLESALNLISNIRYTQYGQSTISGDPLVGFDSSLDKPLYGWATVFVDIIIGLLLKK